MLGERDTRAACLLYSSSEQKESKRRCESVSRRTAKRGTAVHSPLFPVQTSSLSPGEQGLSTQNTWSKAGGVNGRAPRRIFGTQMDQLALSLSFWEGEGERACHQGLRTPFTEHGGSWCIWLSTSFSFSPLWINPFLALFWALGQMVILWSRSSREMHQGSWVQLLSTHSFISDVILAKSPAAS